MPGYQFVDVDERINRFAAGYVAYSHQVILVIGATVNRPKVLLGYKVNLIINRGVLRNASLECSISVAFTD